MNSKMVYEAAKIVGDPHKLVNIISRRVRQLGAGQRPMVDPGIHRALSDIALAEVIEGKLRLVESEANS